MSLNRIQKLLLSEYSEFQDFVILESPFAETTREGQGIRQIQLGLTNTKLILAEDFLNWNIQVEISKERKEIYVDNIFVSPDLDPDIESLELVSVIPIEYVNLSIFHRRKKHTLKARLCNGLVLYFELGGFQDREALWNLWCEKIKFLSPEEAGSSFSESSAASSSSCSTIYIVKSRSGMTSSGKKQVWHVYGKQSVDIPLPMEMQGAGDSNSSPPKRQRWTDRDLFLTDLEDAGIQEEKEKFSTGEFTYAKRQNSPKYMNIDSINTENTKHRWKLSKEVEMNPINERYEGSFEPTFPTDIPKQKHASDISHLVHRFGCGVEENCGIGLYLFPMKASAWELKESKLDSCRSFKELNDHMEEGVSIWEQGSNNSGNVKACHLRRYGICPSPQFLYGLGPFGDTWTKAEKHSVQSRRIASVIELHKNVSEEFTLTVPKNRLIATISCENLTLPLESYDERKKCEQIMRKYPTPPLPTAPTLFWTKNLLFWPVPSHGIYHQQREVLKSFSRFFYTSYYGVQEENNSMYNTKSEPMYSYDEYNLGNFTEDRKCETSRRKMRCIKNDKIGRLESFCIKHNSNQFKRLLRLDIKLTAWDFDSYTLASQLTMIDRDLFLQIPVSELGVLIHWNSYIVEKCFLYPLSSWHRGTPGISAFITFSHRISCLISSEVLKCDTVKERAWIITRFINTASKCYQLQNFQSCNSIICGLQSPAIYRLRQTWRHVRLKHANKYELFEHLCRLYKDTRLSGYRDFSKLSKRTPFIPCFSLLMSYLLDRIPKAILDAAPIKCENSGNRNEHNSLTGKQNPSYVKEIDEPFRMKKGTGEGQELPNYRVRFLQNLSALQFWHHKDQKKENEATCVQRVTTSSISYNEDAKVRTKDWCCWFEKKAPEMRTCLTTLIDEDKHTSEPNKGKCNGSKNFNTSKGLFDDYRLEIFRRIAAILLSSQWAASKYALVQSDMAREYLLKANYREHQENYTLSFQVENT